MIDPSKPLASFAAPDTFIQMGRIEGQLKEIDNRLEMISKRLDDHISSCLTRYIGMVAFVLLAIGAAFTVHIH
jgi:hypothetical protein